MRLLQRRSAPVLAIAAGVVMIAACNTPAPAPEPAAPEPSATAAADPIKRGEMLIVGGLCHDCHTPKKLGPNGPEPDLSRSLSGHPADEKISAPFKGQGGPWTIHSNDNLTAWSGPWGVSFAANLTPEENTGLGIWSEDMFVTALKTGKHMSKGRPILPPMPWNWIAQLPDEDIKAMFAYLKSITPIPNQVPVPLGPDGKPIEAP